MRGQLVSGPATWELRPRPPLNDKAPHRRRALAWSPLPGAQTAAGCLDIGTPSDNDEHHADNRLQYSVVKAQLSDHQDVVSGLIDDAMFVVDAPGPVAG